jgi:DNA modification methylase
MADADATTVGYRELSKLGPHPLNTEVYADRDDIDESFLNSIREQGILEPVVVDEDNTIVSGHRRVSAAEEVGLEEVPVRVEQFESDLSRRESLVHYNQQRDKTFSQKMREAEVLEEIERERARQRQGTRTDTSCSDEQEVDSGLARDEVADEVGFGSGTTYHRAKAIWDARESENNDIAATAENQIEQLDEEEQSISGAYSTIKNEQQRAENNQDEREGEQLRQTLQNNTSNISLLQADAASLPMADETVDVIITSPPYNLGHEEWTMGWRSTRNGGVGYYDDRPENEYREWQREILRECYRVASEGASLFYVHKVRIDSGEINHPVEWLRSEDNPWSLRQEIVWNRKSTHNHEPTLFRPLDERIYWMSKGTPAVPDGGIQMDSVWRFHGPYPNTEHPAPFPEELPKRCLEAVGTEGDVVLDPMGGSMTTCVVADELGYQNIGLDIDRDYVLNINRID